MTTSSTTVCLALSAGFAGGWLLAHRALTSAPATATAAFLSLSPPPPPPPPAPPPPPPPSPPPPPILRAAAALPLAPQSSSHDVVVTMLGSLGIAVASRFMRSLRETGARCALVLLLPSSAASAELRRLADEFGAALYPFDKASEPYKSLRGNRDKLIRYHLAAEYLRRERARHAAGRVLLIDSRDVIFQRDPFTINADAARPLDVFMEDYLRNYSNSGINRQHVVPCFGEAAVKRVLLSPARAVSCSGVTLGSHAAVLRYLGAMWSEIRQPRYSPGCLQHDQAFHNWLLWTGGLGAGVRALSNEEGPVTSIGWPQHLYRDRMGRVLNRRGDVVHIVHQYDRRKRLQSTIGRRYDMVKNPEPAPRNLAPLDTTAAFAKLAASGNWPRAGPRQWEIERHMIGGPRY